MRTAALAAGQLYLTAVTIDKDAAGQVEFTVPNCPDKSGETSYGQALNES